MVETPAFFVPIGEPEKQEEAYAALAQFAGKPVPAPAQRIYSIRWAHDGVEWTATVGKSLEGVERKKGTSKGEKIIRESFVSDPANVLAIFSGSPYIVVTNAGFRGGPEASGWGNPFMAGSIRSVIHFSKL